MCRDLKRLGHNGRVPLRSDHGLAVVRFLQEVATRRGAQGTILEHLPVDESRPNVRAERAVITFEELLRVRKLSLECRIVEKVSVQQCFPVDD